MANLSRSSTACVISRCLTAFAVTAMLAVATPAVAAVCVGDCNRNSAVTVDELILMVNIALGNADQSTCVAGDADASGTISINEIVAAVNSVFDGCPLPVGRGVCGDQVVDLDKGEECDDGGICIGGSNAGVACAADSDCEGEGVCDAFGVPGGGDRKACNSDVDCAGAACVHCKPFGGDGCAANCTNETPVVFTVKPGEVEGGDIKIATSGSVVHTDTVPIPLPFSGGTQTFFIGKVRNNRIPVAQKPAFMILPRIPAGSIACACVRGVVVKTCGGTTKEADGVTDSTNCTADPSVCAGKKPCTAVAGPGNATEGTVACDMLAEINYAITQDAGGTSADLLGWYEVVYEDGFVTTIPIRYGVNIAEWNWDKRQSEKDYCYGADAVPIGGPPDNPITFFAFEWTNPRMGKVIKEVRLKSTTGFRGGDPGFTNDYGPVLMKNAVILKAISVVRRRG